MLVPTRRVKGQGMPDSIPITLQLHQDRVSQKMGRCIVRLQLLESQLKRHLPMQQLEGTVETLPRMMEQRRLKFSGMTLGQLVAEFTSNGLHPAPPGDESTDDELALPSGTRGTLRFISTIHMSPQNHVRITGELRELVELRNELVHHFWSRFDLLGIPGCIAAGEYLDDAYQVISHHGKTIADLLRSMAEARQKLGEHLVSEEAANLIDYGIPPDGKINWAITPIVHALHNARTPQEEDGWISLAEAIAKIRTESPDLTPKRYGVSSWRHLLHESQLFQVQKRKSTAGVQVWYRSRKL